MNKATETTVELDFDQIVLRDLLDSEIVLIGGGELVAEFH